MFDGAPAYFQDSNIVWIANDESKVLNKFLYYIYKMQPWRASLGGTIARLYNDDIARTKIPVPPLSAQREVVARLDAAKARAEKLEAKAREGVAVCETMRKAILKEAFEGTD